MLYHHAFDIRLAENFLILSPMRKGKNTFYLPYLVVQQSMAASHVGNHSKSFWPLY